MNARICARDNNAINAKYYNRNNANIINMEFKYAPMFQLGKDETEYYLLTKDYVSVSEFEGHPMLKVQPEGLTLWPSRLFMT